MYKNKKGLKWSFFCSLQGALRKDLLNRLLSTGAMLHVLSFGFIKGHQQSGLEWILLFQKGSKDLKKKGVIS
ncbi:hypothetical protein N473_12935 [Pseudoalteromonas luteoviolacea CPMOR-1]|uniref:Uncharacterized protein n=1 Tax=Pseudoalteromonas luteoviolacea CPMOR-1 TaxID=1365248 RepID=A0A162CAT4_9GAMM|nr:hypothetical protein N473_12935 [Pseudoalteromonas luteoviolacea CPMOR-1]